MKRRTEQSQSNSVLIPLNCLRKSPKNVRQVPHSKQHIEALAVSIQTHGTIQDPVVETERDAVGQSTGCYLVTAGEGRRLAHLLRAKRQWIPADHPIRCTLDDEHSPQAISLAENQLHEPMHPADQFVAIKALIDSGKPLEDVAAEFSLTPIVVQRRLKLDAQFQVAKIEVSFGSDQHSVFRQAYIAKFGRPATSKQTTYRNAMNATFETTEDHWKDESANVTLYQRCLSTDKSCLVIESIDLAPYVLDASKADVRDRFRIFESTCTAI